MIKEILKDIGRSIPDGATPVLRGNRIFFLHPFKRFDPITLTIMAVGAVGTAMQVKSTLQQGKDAEKTGKARAAIDIQNAEATRKASVEKARIQKERGRRLIEEQKSSAAAGGIRINVDSPLVIEAETQANITKDIGFGLETGRAESDAFRASAALEIAQGKAARKQSKYKALSQGLMGVSGLVSGASSAGLFTKKPTIYGFGEGMTAP